MKKLYLLGSLLIQSSLILSNPGFTGLVAWKTLHSKLKKIAQEAPSPINLPTAQEWTPLWAIANKISAETLGDQMVNEWEKTVDEAQLLRLNELFRQAEVDLLSNSSEDLKSPISGFCMYAYEWNFEKSMGNKYPLLYNGRKTGRSLPSPTDLLRSFVKNQQHLLAKVQCAEAEKQQQTMPALEEENPAGPPSPGEKRKKEREGYGCRHRDPRSFRTRCGTPAPKTPPIYTTNPYAMLDDQDA